VKSFVLIVGLWAASTGTFAGASQIELLPTDDAAASHY